MTARRYIAATVTPGKVQLDVVRLFAPDERAAAVALAEKHGVPPLDLSKAAASEGNEHLPAYLLFEPGTPPEEIEARVREVWARQRAAKS